MKSENVALIIAIILSVLTILGVIYNGLSYNNKSELEKCMENYNDYNYCQRYENKGE